MKKIAFFVFALMMALPAISAASEDYFVKNTIDISAHLTNPQAIEAMPGGFLVVDWESDATANVFLLDGQGRLMNETNSTIQAKFNLTRNASVSARITGIRRYNFTSADEYTYAIMDDSRKNITMANSSDFSREDTDFHLPSPEPFLSSDALAGFCTNQSNFWVAIGNRKIFMNFGETGNNSVNQSSFPILGAGKIGGVDCINGNTSRILVLDDEVGIVYVTDKSLLFEFINLSALSGQGLNAFSDIALVNDPRINSPDFYAISNSSKLIYHFNRRALDVLNIFQPNISFTYPPNGQVFNSKFPRISIQFNFSAVQGNDSRSNFDSDVDRLNCTLYLNGTANVSITDTRNNISINNTFNVTLADGNYTAQIGCLGNNSRAKERRTPKHLIVKNTFRHVVWMGDNFSIYYDTDASAFKASMGTNQTELAAPHNITSGEAVNIRISWNNASQNRTIYINGRQEDSDKHYRWLYGRPQRLYLGSRNDTGQINGVISFLQISNREAVSRFSAGDYLPVWTEKFRSIVDKLRSSYFFQFKVNLKRSITNENPTLRFVNISFDDTLMNFTIEPDVGFLDFSFASGDSSATPAGQTGTVPIFTIWNTGNKSFSLQAYSITPFDSCLTVSLFNRSIFQGEGARTSSGNQTINLTASPQNFVGTLSPGTNASVWMNVTASGCAPSAEFFDIEFATNP